MMRLRVLCLLLMAFAGSYSTWLSAQEVADSLSRAADGVAVEDMPLPDDGVPDGILQLDDTRSYGGFLIDMNLFKPMTTAVPPLPGRVILASPTPDYSRLFALPSSATYSQGNFYGLAPWGWSMGSATPTHLQMGQFKLNNGWSLNTYGQYNAQGYRVMNPSALPWERNNFHGAFELKSANGSFGIRVEVKQGRQSPW